ncbi:MAG: hypothetical protein OEV85_08575 [Candidatus Thorarchaeota archaeon]|nr:hypothetical protein [Candidatus Thorarchaeota archaeon]
MGKSEIQCPFCNSEKYKIETHKKTEEFQKLKGGIYYLPTLTRVTEIRWDENPNKGLAVQCKCGRHFFLTGFGNPSSMFTIHTTLPDGHSFAAYCSKCGKSFVSSNMQCPTCGNQL